MHDHNEVIALPDSQKITFKEIAKSVVHRDKAEKLKARACAIMGAVLETEESRQQKKHDEKYVRTAAKKTTLDKYLAFLSAKPAECSALARSVIFEFWAKEKDMNGPTRLNVRAADADVEGARGGQREHGQEPRLLPGALAAEGAGLRGVPRHHRDGREAHARRRRVRGPEPAADERAGELLEVACLHERRNSKVGYCQGLNMLVSYFLHNGLTEEVDLGQ